MWSLEDQRKVACGSDGELPFHVCIETFPQHVLEPTQHLGPSKNMKSEPNITSKPLDSVGGNNYGRGSLPHSA